MSKTAKVILVLAGLAGAGLIGWAIYKKSRAPAKTIPSTTPIEDLKHTTAETFLKKPPVIETPVSQAP